MTGLSQFDPGGCCCVDCTIFSDSFDRTSIGSNWNIGAGTWTVATTDGGQLTTSSANAIINPTVGGSLGKASVDVSGSGQLQVMLVGYDSIIGAELDTGAGTFSIIQNQIASGATLALGIGALLGGSPSLSLTGSPYVWTVTVSGSPTSGTYQLIFTPPGQYSVGSATATINWNDPGSTVASKLQTAIQTLAGLSGATVTAAADTGTSPNFTHLLTVSGVPWPSVTRTVLRQCTADDDEGTIAICADTYPAPAVGGIMNIFTASLNGVALLTWADEPGACGGRGAILMTGSLSGTATFQNFLLTNSACGQTGCPPGAICCWPLLADGTLPAEMQVEIYGATCSALNGTYLLPQCYPGTPADLDSDESGLTGGTPGIATTQTATFVWAVAISGSPTGGTYDLIFSPGSAYTVGPVTATINWNDPGSTVASKLQTAIQALAGLSGATVSAASDSGSAPNLTHTLTVSGVSNPSCPGTTPSFFGASYALCSCYVLTGLSIVCGAETITEIIFFTGNGDDDNSTCILRVQAPGLAYQFDVGLGPAPSIGPSSAVTYSTTAGCNNSATLSPDPSSGSGTAFVSIP